MPGMRVVLDTNILVSALAYPNSIPGKIVGALRQGSLEVALSRYILDEMVRVLPRLSKNPYSAEQIRDLADSFMFLADIVEPGDEKEEALRDAADQPVLATLIAAKGHYLVTGDKDLLMLAERYPIVTAAAFWSRHGN